MPSYLGSGPGEGDPRGILLPRLVMAIFNDLWMTLATRKKWCLQAIETIKYIHRRGVAHVDLRPENYLIHEATPMSLDLLLCL